MLWTISDLPGFEVWARDGEAGRVRDLYFADDRWDVRYLVVESGSLLHRERRLIPPAAVEVLDGPGRRISISMTKGDVSACPPADGVRPVSLQKALRYRNFVAWPAMWLSAYAVTPGGGTLWASAPSWPDAAGDDELADPHLRSAAAVLGYSVVARDMPVGRLHDFALTDDWRIEDVVVETDGWPHRRRVLVAPYWIERVSWEMSSVFLSISPEGMFRIAESRQEFQAAIHLPRHAHSS